MDFFTDLLNKKKKDTLINNIYKVPKKEHGVNLPRFQQLEPDIIHQADLLYLPDDNGYKYALVVIDTGTSITDAEPLKSKDQKEVLRGFKTIYEKRHILNLPKMMQVDAGTEFKGIVENYFKNNDIAYRIAKIGRHRAQGKVERRNQLIGTYLFKRMVSEEAITGEVSKAWVNDLPKLIKVMNKKTKEQKPQKPLPEKTLCSGDTCNLLPIGTKVRVALEYPIGNIHGERLFGRFRSTDIRWNMQPRVIENIVLKPKSPPLYILNKIPNEPVTAYTKQQLQPLNKNEKAPIPSQVLRKEKPDTYNVEKIIDKKKIKGKIFYRVKWLGYSIADSTFEPRTQLIQDVPNIINEYEKNNS